MSRSRKKTPIHANAGAHSEKDDKRLWHKRMRTHERDRLIVDPESETTHEHEVSNRRSFNKDGKHYYPNDQKLMRK